MKTETHRTLHTGVAPAAARRAKKIIPASLVMATLLLGTATVTQAQRTWDGGGANSNWTTAENWDSDTAPVANNSLTFTGTTQTTTNNNFAANTQFNGLTITNSDASSPFTLNGNAINLNGALTSGVAANIINLNIRFLSNQNTSVSNSLTINGVVSGNAGTSLTKRGSGTLTLTATNTFNGDLRIDEGSAVVNTIGDSGVASNAGAGSLIRIGEQGRNGVLTYTGTAQSTDRQVQVGSANGSGTATITNNGSGALTFTNATFTTTYSATAASTLILNGTNTGANEIQGVIQDRSGTGTLGLTKSGASDNRWILSGANTYTGNTLVSAGTLQLGNGGTTGSLSTASNISISSGATFAVNRSNNVVQGTDFETSISGAGNFFQAGSGTTTLSGTNSYSGSTTVTAGTLLINGSTNNSDAAISSGGSLGGNGSVKSIVLNSGAFLTPGSTGAGSVGTLNTNNGAFLWNGGTAGQMRFDLGTANASDSLALGAGAFTKGTGGLFQFDFLGTGTASNLYTLLTFGSNGGFSLSDFSFTNLGSGLSGNFVLNSNNLQFNVIPEPSTFILLGLGLVVLLSRVRRRTQASL